MNPRWYGRPARAVRTEYHLARCFLESDNGYYVNYAPWAAAPNDPAPIICASRSPVRYFEARNSRRIDSRALITSSRFTRRFRKLSFRLNAFVGGRYANT